MTTSESASVQKDADAPRRESTAASEAAYGGGLGGVAAGWLGHDILSQPANAGVRTLAMRRAQQTYGNRTVQRMVSPSGAEPRSSSTDVLPPGGHPLGRAARTTMESRFDADFGNVRIHDDTQAATAAHALGADAYTSGRDIYFGPGKYDPDSRAGQHLLAHELAHVIQQSVSDAPIAQTARPATDAPSDDRYEVEAEQAADAALGNRSVGALSSISAGTVQRAPEGASQGKPLGAPPGAPSPLIVDPNWQPTIVSRYPLLATVLSEADLVGLTAAAEVRYSAINKRKAQSTAAGTGTPTPEVSASTGKIATSSISIPLLQLLSPEAQFVDVDSWETVYSVVRAHGAPELVGGLLRNEIVRRFFNSSGLSPSKDKVEIQLNDPDGKVAGPATLQYLLQSKKVSNTLGIITVSDLVSAFKAVTLAEVIGGVTGDANKVALAAALVEEFEVLSKKIPDLSKDVTTSPKDHSPRELRSVAARVGDAAKQSAGLEKKSGPLPAAASGLAARFEPLVKQIKEAISSLDRWRAAHPVDPSVQELNDEAGTYLVTRAGKNWDAGGMNAALAGIQYSGAAGVAIVDGLQNLLTFGFHSTAGDISRAYQRGDISWNQADELVTAAAERAIVVGIITVALTVATAGLGAGVATSLNLARGGIAFGMVSGSVNAGVVTFGSMVSQTAITSVVSFSDPTSQAIWGQGAYTPGQIAMGVGTSMLVGGLMGPYYNRPPMKQLNIKGFDIDVHADGYAFGTHSDGRVIYIRPGGGGVYRIVPNSGGLLEEIQIYGAGGVPSNMINRVAGAPGMRPVPLLGSGDAPLVPVEPGTGGGTSLVLPNNAPLMPPPMSPMTGNQVIAGYLASQAMGGAPSTAQLMSGYNATLSPPPMSYNFGLLPSGPQPFGLLPPGPQPFGLLPPGPQPFGLLPAPQPPSELLLAPEARHIPGTPGIVTGGSSSDLGQAIVVGHGLPGGTSLSGWQAHHIIPSELRGHPVLVKIGMHMDDPSNGIMLPEANSSGLAPALPVHEGYHGFVNQAAKIALDAMDINLPESVLQIKVFALQQRLRAAIERNQPLYGTRGATKQQWIDIANPKP